MTSPAGTAGAPRMTLDAMRADIARVLHEDPSEIGDEDSLIDLGLDSIRAMALVTRWRDQGVAMTFADLAEVPTLAHWWQTAQAVMARGAQQLVLACTEVPVALRAVDAPFLSLTHDPAQSLAERCSRLWQDYRLTQLA